MCVRAAPATATVATDLLLLSSQDLAMVGYALAKLGLRPPSTWLRRYCALLLKYKAGLYHNKTLLTQVCPCSLRKGRVEGRRRGGGL